ncbi:hypothetical protein YC2023_011116 [Brassica napus]
MKRKHVAPLGADGRLKPSQSESKQRTRVSSHTKDVSLSTVFARLLNDVTSMSGTYVGSCPDLLVNMDDLKSIECSSQDSSGTDRSDGEQSIELEPEVDNQSERVSLLAAMFRKTFSEVKKKVKTVPPKDDG